MVWGRVEIVHSLFYLVSCQDPMPFQPEGDAYASIYIDSTREAWKVFFFFFFFYEEQVGAWGKEVCQSNMYIYIYMAPKGCGIAMQEHKPEYVPCMYDTC